MATRAAKLALRGKALSDTGTEIGIVNNADATAITIDSSEKVGINNSSPTQRLEINGNAQFNMYDNGSGAGGYYTTKGMQIGNAFDAGLSGGDDDRNAIVWNERGTSLLFGTNNIEYMRMASSGRVGINTNSPDQTLEVKGNIRITRNGGSSDGSNWTFTPSHDSSSVYGSLYLNPDVSTAEFSLMNDKFRFKNDGKLFIGTSWNGGSGKLHVQGTTDPVCYFHQANSADIAGIVMRHARGLSGYSGKMVAFQRNDGTQVGSIFVGASATSYNTSSDYRLKENVTPMTGAAATVKLLKPCNFDWIEGGNTNGFIAHELAEVIPEAATGTKDAMIDESYEVTPAVLDDEGNETTAAVMGTRSVPDLQGVDQSKLVPLLTATIQELIARIEALENN